MIDKYTAQATTEEEAIKKGLQELGINQDEADIEINAESKKGFLGIGQKDAVVTVKRKNESSLEEIVKETETSLDPTLNLSDTEESNEELKVKESTGSTKEKTVVSTPAEETEETSGSKEQYTESVEVEEDEEPLLNGTDEKAIYQVKDYLMAILIHMGIEDANVVVSQDEERIYYDIETEDAGLVIGRHGKVLDGLQTLVQIQIHQLADRKLYAKVDAENYRKRRQNTVQQLAKKTADKVKKTKQPVILEPMPAHERKQIHHYLHKVSGIETHSEGKSPHRYLVVEIEE